MRALTVGGTAAVWPSSYRPRTGTTTRGLGTPALEHLYPIRLLQGNGAMTVGHLGGSTVKERRVCFASVLCLVTFLDYKGYNGWI